MLYTHMPQTYRHLSHIHSTQYTYHTHAYIAYTFIHTIACYHTHINISYIYHTNILHTHTQYTYTPYTTQTYYTHIYHTCKHHIHTSHIMHFTYYTHATHYLMYTVYITYTSQSSKAINCVHSKLNGCIWSMLCKVSEPGKIKIALSCVAQGAVPQAYSPEVFSTS